MKAKRRWSWTDKNKRRTQSEKWRTNELPKSAKKEFSKFYRNNDKRSVIKELNNSNFEYIQDRRRKTETSWNYW